MQRRDFISNGLMSVPAWSVGLPLFDRGLRVLFVTDMHLSPSIDHAIRSAAFLRDYINRNAIDLVINGGDTVYDVAKLRSTEGNGMWEMAVDLFASLNKPVFHCIGNHDVYEWELHEQLEHPQQFKEAVVKRLKMPGRYYAFTKGKWKFIVLDSLSHRPKGYRGELDEEQWQWLLRELARDAGQPTCIVSHIPIITACDALYLSWEKHHLTAVVAERLTHYDAARIFEATEKVGVKLYLHGHLHMREQIQYKQSAIHTHTAFCGDMWRGEFHGFKPGFTIFELADDGAAVLRHIDLPLSW